MLNKKVLRNPLRIKCVFCLLPLLVFHCMYAQNAGRLAVSKQAMVVSAEERATRAGLAVLKEGGNAVDAAVAIGFALAVTYPSAGNIGGGSFLLVRMSDGRASVIDARETAPLAARKNMYLDAGGRPVPLASLRGPLASGVPGAVDGLLLALRRYGTWGRVRVMQPALALARDGFRLKKYEANFLERQLPYFEQYPASMRVYTRYGKVYREDDLFRQPELAATLDRIARLGRDGFYQGTTADSIVAHMRRDGGIITHEDLRAYSAVERRPLSGNYRGYTVLVPPPPSGGGVALLQLLNILEGYVRQEIQDLEPRTLHRTIEAMRRVYRDRWRFLGDPAFVSMPVDSLISKETAGRLRETITDESATDSRTLAPGGGLPHEGENTTHYCVVDRWGNTVSVTTTLNDVCGNKSVVPGAGFLLNNEMDDFSTAPGVLNQFGLPGSVANVIEPRKRMLSSMVPTIIIRDGKPVMLLGSPGGSRIITSVLQVMIAVIDRGLRIDSAVARGRMHHQWIPDTLYVENGALPQNTIDILTSMGHAVKFTGPFGRVEGIVYNANKQRWEAASDPRGHGMAAGY